MAVYGDITDSEIHNQFFGHYSFGHKGGNWSGNHVHDNVGYGFDPHDDSDNAVIANNHVHNNGWHGISEFGALFRSPPDPAGAIGVLLALEIEEEFVYYIVFVRDERLLGRRPPRRCKPCLTWMTLSYIC